MEDEECRAALTMSACDSFLHARVAHTVRFCPEETTLSQAMAFTLQVRAGLSKQSQHPAVYRDGNGLGEQRGGRLTQGQRRRAHGELRVSREATDVWVQLWC